MRRIPLVLSFVEGRMHHLASPEPVVPREALRWHPAGATARDRLLLAGADISPLVGWDVPQFPLKGGQIVARGVAAGPEVARVMQAVERRWVEEGFPGPERIEELVGETLARVISSPRT